MYGKSGDNFLIKELAKKGYEGNLEELHNLLVKAEGYSSLNKFI